MANGLFADFGQTSPDEIRKQLVEEQRQQFKSLVSGAATKKEKAAGNLVEGALGLAQAGAFGDKIEGMSQVRSPELEAARGDAALMKGISEIEINPTTPEYSRKVAEMARAAGNDKLAISALLQEGERTKAGKIAAAKAKVADKKALNEEFDRFPTGVKEEIIATSPELLSDIDGMTPEKAKAISARVGERAEFKRIKAKKDLEAITKVTATKVNQGDIAGATQVVDALTKGDFTDDDIMPGVASLVAQRAQAKANALKDAGEPIPELQQLWAASFSELQEDGTVNYKPGDEYLGGKVRVFESLEVNADKLKAPAAKRRIVAQ